MLAQGVGHGAVALPKGMDVTEGYRQKYGVVQYVGHVQVAVAVGNHQKVVGAVVVVVAVFHDNMVFGVHFVVQRVQTAVARHLKHPFAAERAVVDIVALLQIEMHLDIR